MFVRPISAALKIDSNRDFYEILETGSFVQIKKMSSLTYEEIDKIIFVIVYREYCHRFEMMECFKIKNVLFPVSSVLTALVLWSYKNELMNHEAEERDQVEAHKEAQLQDQVQIRNISQNSKTKIQFDPVI